MLWWKKHVDYVDNNELVTGHEYAVVSVDLSANPPTVKLRNPWGSGGATPQFVTVTQDQCVQYCNEVDFGDS
jgi:hypothetical protein